MNNVFSIVFILSDAEVQPSQIDLVALHKQRCDEELNTALRVAQQTDSRSFLVWKTDWKETPVLHATRYSRMAYLFLINPEEATSSQDLVWMPEACLEPSASLYTTPSGKAFRPAREIRLSGEENKLLWRLESVRTVLR